MPDADRVVEALAASGVRCVFGIPGTQTVALYDALRRSSIRTVLAASETGAAFMAGGWARATGEPGLVLTTLGPGFLWALPGVGEARLDSIPLVHLSASPARLPWHRAGPQQIDQGRIAAPLVKAVLEASPGDGIGDVVREAIRLAAAGEPGPVLVQLTEAPHAPAPPPLPAVPAPGIDWDAVCRRVAAARHPVILAGQGALGVAAEVERLAARLSIPVLTTPSARGLVPEDHPWSLAFEGLAGDVDALNRFLAAADLVLVLAARLGHGGTCGFGMTLRSADVIHIDASDEVLGANYPASLTIAADARVAMQVLNGIASGAAAWTPGEIAGWRATLSRTTWEGEPRVAGTGAGTAPAFFASLRRALPREAALVLDSGLHQILARRHYPVLAAGGLIFPSDLQSMGFAIPTAIGASLARPERPVVAMVGDGGFAMSGLELLTALREGARLVVLLMADGYLGQIRQQQLREYGADHAVALRNPNFGMLATSLGIAFAEAGSDIGEVVCEALQKPGVTLVEVPVGDNPGLRWRARAVRAKEGVRRAIGPTAFARLKPFLGMRHQP